MPSEPFIAEISLFAGNFAPRNYALCQGQLLSIAQNTALFSLLGTTYGGNGQTTFGLPDFRGRVPIGTGQAPGFPAINLGEMGGAPTHTLIITEMPAHNHTVQSQLRGTSINGNLGTPDNVVFATNDNISSYTRNTSEMDLSFNPAALSVAVGIAGASQAHNNMQPYLGMNFVIALQGIFPSRN